MIVRKKHKSKFTVIPNSIFSDNLLSVEAMGVLCCLLSCPHNWQIRHSHLQQKYGLTRPRLHRIFNELRAAGYMARGDRVRGSGGRLGSYDYTVWDEPQVDAEAAYAAMMVVDQKELSACNNDDEDATTIQKPMYENQSTISYSQNKNGDTNNSNTKHSDSPMRAQGARRQGQSGQKAGERAEVIQSRIAQRLGAHGWEILMNLPSHEVDQLTAQERNGRLTDHVLVELNLRFVSLGDGRSVSSGTPLMTPK